MMYTLLISLIPIVLTLLAVDGNPLRTISMNTLIFLNNTLKGLSLGGRYLVCDCKLRWIAEWIRKGDLQVCTCYII